MRNGQIRKKMFRRLAIMLVWGMLLCFLCACGGMDSGSAENIETVDLGSTDLTYTDDHVSGILCEGVEVDADIPDLSNVTSDDIVRACMQLPDDDVIESMKAYVFNGYTDDEIKQEYYADMQLTNYYVGDKNNENIVLGVSETPGHQFVCFFDYVRYPNNLPYITRSIPLDQHSEMFALDKENLNFMDKENAVKMVMKELSEWGIEPINDPQVFCIDGAAWYAQLDNPVEPVSVEEMDCYYMVFDVGYNNIPYTCFEIDFSTTQYASAAKLEVHFTEKGIVRFDYSSADYMIEEIVEQHDSVITLDQAMSQVQKKYEGTVGISEIHIPKIYFQYIPTDLNSETGECTLVPSWVIQPATNLTTGEEESETYLDVIVVNAITGEIMM